MLRVPSISSNLASVHKICHGNHCWCYFDEHVLSIQALVTGKVLYRGKSEDGVYPIYPYKAPHLALLSKVCNNAAKTNNCNSFNKTLWRMRLGHPNDQVLRFLFPDVKSVPNNCVQNIHTCIPCLYGKMHNLPFPKSQFHASFPFELVHSNVWGPAPVTSIDGYRFYVLFVDHFTRFTWIFLLKAKSEIFSKILLFKAMVETQFSTKIRTLRSEGGGEYTSSAFKTYLQQHGIIHQISCPYTPQQNGLVERKHRHLIETTITILSQASMPHTYWSYAVLTAVTLVNLLPTPVLKCVSPWFKFYSSKPDLSQLRVFGCACYPNLRVYTSHKLSQEPKSVFF